MKPDFSGTAFLNMLKESDRDTLQHQHYCYQLGRTYLSLCLMEDSIISAMATCRRIEVRNCLGEDANPGSPTRPCWWKRRCAGWGWRWAGACWSRTTSSPGGWCAR